MKSRLIFAALLLLAAPSAAAGEPDRFFGEIEWGAYFSLFRHQHSNYLDSEGSRVDNKSNEARFYTSAGLIACAGYRISPKLSLSLGAGFVGLEDNARAFALLGRVSYLPCGSGKPGPVFKADAGLGIRDVSSCGPVSISSVSGGYRLRLSRQYYIDLTLSLRGALDHPSVTAYDGIGRIDSGSILLSRAFYQSACFNICIGF